jgi:hypothetical protein
MESPFIINLPDYLALRGRAESVFRLDVDGLPHQVFSDDFTNYRFLEFDRMLFPDFWGMLFACADQAGDVDVSLIVHEPDPETYFFRHFGRYGALRFSRTTSAEDYSKALCNEPSQSSADAFLYVGSVFSFCGNSQRWAFWGERDLGVGVAATRRDARIEWPVIPGITWFDVEGALSNLMALNFKDFAVPQEIALEMRRNFSR